MLTQKLPDIEAGLGRLDALRWSLNFKPGVLNPLELQWKEQEQLIVSSPTFQLGGGGTHHHGDEVWATYGEK